MCVYSMVHDHFLPQFPAPVTPTFPKLPDPTKTSPPYWPTTTISTWPALDLDRLEKLINDFKEAAEAAQKIDVLTKQPDCVDPEKEKLSKKILELEAQLAKAKRALRLKNALGKSGKLKKKYLSKKK